MSRADGPNSHVYPVITEMTDLSSHIFSTNKDKSKGIIVHKTLPQNCSTDEEKSKHSIINKTSSQNCSADEDELSSTEEEKSECTIMEQKDANNEITYDVPNYFNVFSVFKHRRKILERLDMSYERAYMATPK